MNKLFFDTETTGFASSSLEPNHPDQAHLVQLALILIDDNGGQVDKFSAIINPGEHVNFASSAVAAHGITKERALAEGIDPKEAVQKFLDFIERAGLLGAHNIEFDLKIITLAIARTHNETWENPLGTFCTMKRATDVVALPPTQKMINAGRNHYKSPNLTECIRYFFDEELEGAHDALVDVEATIRVYLKLMELGIGNDAPLQNTEPKGSVVSDNPIIKAVHSNPGTVLTDTAKLNEYLIEIRKDAEARAGKDVSTKKGQDRIRTAAASVSKAKVLIDKAGQKKTEIWRKRTTQVNEARKLVATEMDQIRDAVRKPLTEWEEGDKLREQLVLDTVAKLEQAHIVRIDETSEDVQRRLDEIVGLNVIVEENFKDQTDSVSQMRDDVIASLRQSIEDIKVDEWEKAELAELRAAKAAREAEENQKAEEARQEEARKAQAELDRLAEERRQKEEAERIEVAQKEAARQATEEAERVAAAREAERQAEIDRQREEALQAQIRAEQEAQAKIDAANERAAEIERAAQAEKDRIAMIEAERIAEELRIADEKAAREADQNHRAQVKNTARDALIEHAGLSDAQAQSAVLSIIAGSIPAISITF